MNLSKIELTLDNITVNPEKAGGDDKGETGSAINLSGDVLIDKLVGLGDYVSSLGEFLYGKDAKGGPGHELVAKDVTKIEMKMRLEKVQVSIGGAVLEDERVKFSGVRLNVIEMVPKHGRAVGLTVKLYVHPEAEGWNDLVRLAKQLVTVSIWGGSRIEDKKKPAAAQSQLALGAAGDVKTGESGTTTMAPSQPVDAAPGTH